MKWIHAVEWENVDCSICGESLDDPGGYIHDDLSNEQWDFIETRWGDPALFVICESCLGVIAVLMVHSLPTHGLPMVLIPETNRVKITE